LPRLHEPLLIIEKISGKKIIDQGSLTKR
jgi:hypothetical protein